MSLSDKLSELESYHPHAHKVITECVELLCRKSRDYGGDSYPFQAFKMAGELAGFTPGQVIETLIGIKSARLRTLAVGDNPFYESVRDTMIDRACYCILQTALKDSEENTPP